MGAVKSRYQGSYSIHRNVDNKSENGTIFIFKFKSDWKNRSKIPDGAIIKRSSIKMAGRQVRVFTTDEDIVKDLTKLLCDKSTDAIRKHGQFRLGVSGGSLPKYFCKALPTVATDFSKWKIFFCDERLVTFDNNESTYGIYADLLFNKPNSLLKEEQFIKINPDLNVSAAAQDYTLKIAEHFLGEELPRFDMLLLGMGPDGHTCSLFPGHKLLKENSIWVAAISDSPKPPDCRITLTFPVINNSACVTFVCTGAAKAEVIKSIIEKDNEDYPAACVRPVNGELHWILDQGAASRLII